MNYLGCASCHQRDFVLISNKATVEDDGEEIVTYDRNSHLLFDLKYVHTVSPKLIVLFLPDVCKNCDHVIASHEYTFSVVDEYQVKCHMYYRIEHHSWLNKYFCLACPWFLLLCRSTLCSACCVERQRTPSVCYLMTPDSLHRCSSCSSFTSQLTFFTLSRDSKCPNCFFDSC